MSTTTHSKVSEYYGKVLETKKDLKTSACCSIEGLPEYVKEPLRLIEDEIMEKFYGCGSPLPLDLEGKKVLDLGCGTGRDCYVASYLVGEEGEVVGVDMTPEQLEVANRHLDTQMKKFGYSKPNVRFLHGFIEELDQLGLPENYFDVVISNCVINLSPDKKAVLNGVNKLLKEGGEFYFSDVYSDRRLPQWAREDDILLGECLGGALYWKDFERMAVETGFLDPRIFSGRPISLDDEYVKQKIGFANFFSVTYRLFKLSGLEDACEDYGQVAYYKGTVKHAPYQFVLDNHHLIEKGKPFPVCSNTAMMLTSTRFKDHFEVTGDLKTHYGLFGGCGAAPSVYRVENDLSSGDCC